MSELIEITQSQAIENMDNNLKRIKEYSNSDTFLLLGYDLENCIPIRKQRVNRQGGIKIIECCKTFILNEDQDVDKISILSMYTSVQKDIYNILPIGEKYDMIIISNKYE